MGRTACTEPQCLYKGALYLLPFIGTIYYENEVTLQTHSCCSLTSTFRSVIRKFKINAYVLDKSRIAMTKAAFNKKKKKLFTSKLDLNLRKKLVKCYVWTMALYGAETRTLRATDHKRLESSEMWCWRRTEKISWTDNVRNEEEMSRGISYMKYEN